MMKNTDREQKIEATLQSLDNVERVEVSPFFYGKLKARMEQENPNSIVGTMLFGLRPAVSIAALLIFILLNTIAISTVWQQRKSLVQSAELKSFASEYDLNVYTVYDNKINRQ